MGRLKQITAPVNLPLGWDGELDTHLRVDSTDEMARILDMLVPAAVSWVESQTNRALITQTWRLDLDGFPGSVCDPCFQWDENGYWYIRVPKPPLQSVTSITYVDPDGAAQTMSAGASGYTAEVESTPISPKCPPGRIYLSYGVTQWPQTRVQPNAVSITFVCGYGAEGKHVPAPLRESMCLVIGDSYEHREDSFELEITRIPMNAAHWAAAHMVEA